MSNDPIEKIRRAIRNVFSENDNRPLDTYKLFQKIGKKLGNGEIGEKFLTIAVIDMMLDRFELIRLPDNRIRPN